MPYKDKEKQLAAQRKTYAKYSKRYTKNMLDRRDGIKKWYITYKRGLSCSKCGSSHYAIIDFHHVSEKTEVVSNMVVNGYSIKSIKREIERCIVLCSNCHRILHAERKDTR